MSVNGRLANLEAVFLPPLEGPPELDGLPHDFLDREVEHWDAILSPALDSVGDAGAEKLAVEFAQARFWRLESLVDPPPDQKPFDHRWAVGRFFVPTRRMPRALATFIDRLPPAMRAPVLRAGLTEPRDEYRKAYTWLEDWLDNLCELCSRVPPDIDRGAFGALLNVFLTRRQEVDSFFGVCPATGLRVPRVKLPPGGIAAWPWPALPGKTPLVGPPPWYDAEEFFAHCPGCAAEKYGTLRCQQASEQAARQQPWPEWAEAELSPDRE
jgi:hypothetical protein